MVPFCGSYLESYKVTPKSNYSGARGQGLRMAGSDTLSSISHAKQVAAEAWGAIAVALFAQKSCVNPDVGGIFFGALA